MVFYVQNTVSMGLPRMRELSKKIIDAHKILKKLVESMILFTVLSLQETPMTLRNFFFF